tara:strand:- start:5 stop:307 length:303 start_codon:yes stop_codon:yes gene_type:complete
MIPPIGGGCHIQIRYNINSSGWKHLGGSAVYAGELLDEVPRGQSEALGRCDGFCVRHACRCMLCLVCLFACLLVCLFVCVPTHMPVALASKKRVITLPDR